MRNPRIRRFATGGVAELLGSYTSNDFGSKFNQLNPYTIGMGPEKLYNFAQGAAGTPGVGSPAAAAGSGLLTNSFKPQTAWDVYNSWDPAVQKYYIKKGAITNPAAGTPSNLAGQDASWLLGQVNKTLGLKGASPISNLSQINEATSPLIAQRNKRGLSGPLGTLLPIALSLAVPGIGTALGITSLAGTAALGAGLGAIGGGISSGSLKGALMGGITGGIGGGLGYTAPAAAAAKGGIAGGLAGGLAGAAAKAPVAASSSGLFGNIGSILGNAGTLAKYGGYAKDIAGIFGGGQQQQQQGGTQNMSQDQIAQLIMMLQAQQQGGQSRGLFGSAAGQGYAQGGRIPQGYAQGGQPQAQSRLVEGAGDGMSDGVHATINDTEPAKLSDGEHVIPALQVAMLGRGSTKAGSKRVADLVLKEIESMYGKGVNPRSMQKKAMGKV